MFGQKLKELRLEKGLTQRQLAQQLDYNQSMISQWESSICEPTANAIIKVAIFFDVTTDYLLGREDDFGNITILSGNISGSHNTVNSHNTINAHGITQLSEADAELLHKYHSASPELRKAVDKLLS